MASGDTIQGAFVAITSNIDANLCVRQTDLEITYIILQQGEQVGP